MIIFVVLVCLVGAIGALGIWVHIDSNRPPPPAPAPTWPAIRPESVVAYLHSGIEWPCEVRYAGMRNDGHIWAISHPGVVPAEIQHYECATLAPGNGLVVFV